MFNRRDFIRTLPGLPAALCCSTSGATTVDSASKACLIVGNSAYPRTQLRNPVNDALAISELFTAAGFSVDLRQDLKLDSFREAVEQFGETVQRDSTKLAVFYYAGHGVQLDWRNYLLPVDAKVSSGDELKARCVDLALLLGKFASTKDKTHVIFLDACRNDPFGGSYRPAQTGLSQFDAPVGSLLAYSTAPGSVAFDGEGTNSPYARNVVRELSRRSAKLEDALKRVRLNVRLESRGLQIPWESTSLESDVYIFDEGQKPLSAAELEESVKEDLATWERIKSSQDAQDWIAYLRTFPNGRFTEIAQDRLARLIAMQTSVPLAPATSVVSTPVAPPSVSVVATAPVASATLAVASAASVVPVSPAAPHPPMAQIAEAPMIVVEPGAPPPELARPSGNPFSAGTYPLGRVFSVGDEASFRTTDILTGLERSRYIIRITKVDVDADRIEGNDGQWVFDAMGNALVTPGIIRSVPAQLVPAEFQIGKKWSAAWTEHNGRSYELNLRVAAREVVRASQVEFFAFRVESRGISTGPRNFTRFEFHHWYVPGLNFPVARENLHRAVNMYLISGERTELLTLRQQKTGMSSTASDGAIPGTRAAERLG